MSSLRRLGVAFSILALPGCASIPEEPRLVQTTSGWPEALFVGRSQAEVSTSLANLCREQGYLALDVRPEVVSCEMRASGEAAVLLELPVGTKARASHFKNLRFDVKPSAEGVHVTARQWITTTGSSDPIPMNGNNQINDVQKLLLSLGGRSVPAGS